MGQIADLADQRILYMTSEIKDRIVAIEVMIEMMGYTVELKYGRVVYLHHENQRKVIVLEPKFHGYSLYVIKNGKLVSKVIYDRFVEGLVKCSELL